MPLQRVLAMLMTDQRAIGRSGVNGHVVLGPDLGPAPYFSIVGTTKIDERGRKAVVGPDGRMHQEAS